MILIKHKDKGNFNPAFYWSLEDFVLNNLIKEDKNDIYFFTWKVKGTISGKNQVIENEVNLEYTKQNNINVYRRPSGGGTVYADENNLMFSIIKRKTEGLSFENEIKLIVKALNDYNIPAKFKGRNDIVIDDKKISGNSFFTNDKGMIIHGTLLFNSDIEKMVKSITPSQEKLISKGIESIRSRVANISSYTNSTLDEFRFYLENSLTLKKYQLSEIEIKNITNDSKKYLTKEWIFGEQPLHTKVVTKRFSFGQITLNVTISYNVIKTVLITGDFFELQSVNMLENLLKDIPLTKKDINSHLNEIDTTLYILDFKTEHLVELLTQLLY